MGESMVLDTAPASPPAPLPRPKHVQRIAGYAGGVGGHPGGLPGGGGDVLGESSRRSNWRLEAGRKEGRAFCAEETGNLAWRHEIPVWALVYEGHYSNKQDNLDKMPIFLQKYNLPNSFGKSQKTRKDQ